MRRPQQNASDPLTADYRRALATDDQLEQRKQRHEQQRRQLEMEDELAGLRLRQRRSARRAAQ